MKNITVEISILLVFFCVGCNSQKNKDYNLSGAIEINLNTNNLSNFDINQVADFHSLIPLETTAESLIGDITKLFIIDSLIIIYDKKTNAILVFDDRGNYKHKIGRPGNGPGEYVRILDVFLDEERNMIQLSDGMLKRIKTYSINGDFLSSTIVLDYPFVSFYPLDNGYWAVIHYQNSSRDNLVLMDENFNVQKKWFSFTKKLPLVHINHFIEDREHGILFHDPYDNILYKLDEKNVNPYILFTFDNEKISKENIDNQSPFLSSPLFLNAYIHNGKLFFKFSKPQNKGGFMIYNCFLDLNDLQQHVVFKFYENFSKEIPVAPLPDLLSVSDGKLVFQIAPHLFPESAFDNLKGSSLEGINSESNPVLVLYTLHN